MTATSYKEFKLLFDRIPKDRLPFVHFIPIRCGSKVPIGNWKGKVHLSLYECKNVLKTGGNIAVAGIPKGLMFLDIDIKNFPNGIPKFIQDMIPSTFTVKSRSGGRHYYFLNNGEYDNQKFIMLSKDKCIEYDSMEIKTKEDLLKYMNLIHIEVGELRTNWQYVVACGSWVEPETYRCINEYPMTDFENVNTSIHKLFRKGKVKDLTPNRTAPTDGKKGNPISERHREMIERINKNKEGKIEPSKTNAKDELFARLKARGYNVL